MNYSAVCYCLICGALNSVDNMWCQGCGEYLISDLWRDEEGLDVECPLCGFVNLFDLPTEEDCHCQGCGKSI